MNRYRMQAATGWWSPRLHATLVRLLRGFRHWKQQRDAGLLEIEVLGAERVQRLIQNDHAVLITPNHSTHADAYAIYAGADAIGVPVYMMAAWQVFAEKSWMGQQVLRWHGCFSVDREGTDLRAFRQAVEVLERRREPLVVFPEGEVYHCNARVRPFRDGAAAIALSAGKRGRRPIACVPCGIWYEYIASPEQELLALMDDLEREMFWRPRPELPLHERIYRFAEVPLLIKELEFLGRAGAGPLPPRLELLIDRVLSNVEGRYGIAEHSGKTAERVKELRFRVIQELKREDLDADTRRRLQEDLDDVFLAVQLYSYPGDYVAEEPTLERMAETLDKFEEDILNRYSATVRGTRRARLMFGEPIAVERSSNRKMAIPQLTEALEQGVQHLIDQLRTAGPARD